MFDRTENCLYHRNKSDFVLIQRELQAWIPQKFIHRLAMAVCCCRRHIKEKTFQADRERLMTVKTFLYNLLNEDHNIHNGPEHLKQYILMCLDRVTETDYSCCKFLDILHQARHGDFTALYRERKNSDTINEVKSGSKDEDHGVKKKMTKTQIDCMLRKRKRRMQMRVVKLLMFPGNFPKLQSVCKLTEMTKQNNCFVETHNILNNKSFADNKNVTHVKIWTNKVENFEKISRIMIHKAADLQKGLDDLRQIRKTERQNYRARRGYWHESWDKDDIVLQAYSKENMFEDYDLKTWKSKSKAPKAPTSILSKGHCLHCHKDFSTLKDKTTCKHHSGFVGLWGNFFIFTGDNLPVNQTWNCCGQTISGTRIMKTPSYDDHVQTGCVEVTTHVWRVHNRSDHKERKAGASNVNIDTE